MATPQSPAGSRRRLGAELRRLRTRARLTLDDVAVQMTCSTSKISRLETGKGIPKVPDVRELMRIYGVTSAAERDTLLRLVLGGREHGWWESYTEGIAPERFVMDSPSRYPAMESEALAVRSFDIALLHGLLQTPAYARAVMASLLSKHRPSELDQLVELRIRRQQALVSCEPPLELSVVLDEGVLHRVVGSPGLMADQLAAILDRSTLPNVTVQVLPFDAGFHRAHVGSFVVLEFAADADVVYIEGHAGDSYLESAADVDLYKDLLTDVTGRALDPEASRRLIRLYQREHAPSGRVSS